MQTSDVEALYDAELRPIRVWRRNTLGVSKRPDGNADIKLFELRTTPIGVKHRGDDGKIDFEELRAPAKPEVLVGPGRGIVSLWLRKAHLAPGEKTHAIGFDFRGVEKVERMALERFPDRRIDFLGRTARVYTYFGKETVFANDDDVVIGDLAGLVPLGPNAPPPVPTFEPIDPVHSP